MKRFIISGLLAAVVVGLSACGDDANSRDEHDHSANEAATHEHEEGHEPEKGHGSADGHGHGESHEDEAPKGPHGGRLLEDGDFALEVTIFEDGVPPQFRLYPSLRGKPLAPAEVEARIELTRVNGLSGGKIDRHGFEAKDDYLFCPLTVYEPHSFDLKVRAEHAGRKYEWSYTSPEGQTTISAGMAQANGLQIATVGGASLRENIALYGSIRPNAERVRAVTARFPGIVKAVDVQVGDTVKAGQTLATIESNESLQVYAVTAPIAGTITRRAANAGELAGSEALFEVADFSSVWAELSVFPRDRARLKSGQVAEIEATDGSGRGSGTINYVSPAGSASQALTARVVLDNSSGIWTTGQFVNALVAAGEVAAPLVVPQTALQSFRDWDVVFVVDGDRYQALPVKLGRRDASQVEVLDGLEPGARVVVGNSYLLKADIEKSGASHDH